MSTSRDPDAWLPLTPALFYVLVALADEEKHGYAIIKEIARRTDGGVRLSAGTLYALIRRDEADGLIVETDERPSNEAACRQSSRKTSLKRSSAIPSSWTRRSSHLYTPTRSRA